MIPMERQSLLLTAPRQLTWVTETLPALQPDEVLVRTTASAVSVGAELPQYLGGERVATPHGYPRMTGYESVGVVMACGAAVDGLAVGDRVVAFYGHRTLGIVPQRKALKVPVGVSDAVALLAILTCDVAKGIRKLAPGPAESALITGAGAIGLLTLWVLRAYGAQTVDVIEPRAKRRALALGLGARSAFAPNDAPPDAAYPVGFECSSRDAAFATLQARMGVGGRICVLADGNTQPLTLSPDFHARELTVVGSSDGWDYQQHTRWYFARVLRGAPELERLYEERIAAGELAALFERMAQGEVAPVKVLVSYGKNGDMPMTVDEADRGTEGQV